MKQVKEIISKIYDDHKLRKTVIPLFIGNSGLGKTKIIEQFAAERKVTMIEMIGSQLSPYELSGIAIPDKEKEKMVYYDLDRLIDLKDGDILFVDELLASNPSVLSAFLTLLESRKTISGKPLADIMIIAAANKEGMGVLTPAIKERFIWYDVVFDKTMWVDYMIETVEITRNIGNKLSSLIIAEKFSGRNFNTPRSISKAIDMIIKGVPTPYAEEVIPMLEELIENTTTEIIKIGETEFMPNEKMTWLKIKQLEYAATRKQKD